MAIKASTPHIVVERDLNGTDKVVVVDGMVKLVMGGKEQMVYIHEARRLSQEIDEAIAEYRREYFSWHYRPAKENPEGGDAEGGAE